MVVEFDVPLEVAQAAREQAKELSFSDAAKVGCTSSLQRLGPARFRSDSQYCAPPYADIYSFEDHA